MCWCGEATGAIVDVPRDTEPDHGAAAGCRLHDELATNSLRPFIQAGQPTTRQFGTSGAAVAHRQLADCAEFSERNMHPGTWGVFGGVGEGLGTREPHDQGRLGRDGVERLNRPR